MKDFGGMLSYVTKVGDYEKAIEIIKKLSLFAIAESLGGAESLVGHPASMSHGGMPSRTQKK